MDVIVYVVTYILFVAPLTRELLKFAGYAYESWQGSAFRSVTILCWYQLFMKGLKSPLEIMVAFVMMFFLDRFLCKAFPRKSQIPPSSDK